MEHQEEFSLLPTSIVPQLHNEYHIQSLHFPAELNTNSALTLGSDNNPGNNNSDSISITDDFFESLISTSAMQPIVDQTVAEGPVQIQVQTPIQALEATSDAGQVDQGQPPSVPVNLRQNEANGQDEPAAISVNLKRQEQPQELGLEASPATGNDESDSTDSKPNGNKRNRTNYTPQQLELLELTYLQNNRYPPAEIREAVATTLGLKDHQVRIWFQNRRAKDKRRSASQIVPCPPTAILQNIANKPPISSSQSAGTNGIPMNKNIPMNSNNSHHNPIAISIPPVYFPAPNVYDQLQVPADFKKLDMLLPNVQRVKQNKEQNVPSSSSGFTVTNIPNHLNNFGVLDGGFEGAAPPNVNLFDFDWNKPQVNPQQNSGINNNVYDSKDPTRNTMYLSNSFGPHAASTAPLWPNMFMPPDLMTFSPTFFSNSNTTHPQQQQQQTHFEFPPSTATLPSNSAYNIPRFPPVHTAFPHPQLLAPPMGFAPVPATDQNLHRARNVHNSIHNVPASQSAGPEPQNTARFQQFQVQHQSIQGHQQRHQQLPGNRSTDSTSLTSGSAVGSPNVNDFNVAVGTPVTVVSDSGVYVTNSPMPQFQTN